MCRLRQRERRWRCPLLPFSPPPSTDTDTAQRTNHCPPPPTPTQIPYSSPVSVDAYPTYAVTMTLAGLVATAFYFVFQIQGTKRSTAVEMLIAILAAVLLGFGSLFTMLSFGLYV